MERDSKCSGADRRNPSTDWVNIKLSPQADGSNNVVCPKLRADGTCVANLLAEPLPCIRR